MKTLHQRALAIQWQCLADGLTKKECPLQACLEMAKRELADERRCHMFVLCPRKATTTVEHPALGTISVCRSCATWYKTGRRR